MIKGSEIRKADFPIEPILLDRWSPRAMSGEEISQEELMRLFEAARWRRLHSILSSGVHFMPAAARNTGRGSSIYSSTRTKLGQKTLPFSLFSFRESFLI